MTVTITTMSYVDLIPGNVITIVSPKRGKRYGGIIKKVVENKNQTYVVVNGGKWYPLRTYGKTWVVRSELGGVAESGCSND